MTLPNFLIIGAAKSGTTALYHLLSAHPDAYLSSFKEPYFLSQYAPSPHSIRTLEAYQKLFEDAGDARRIGEASAGYLYCDQAPGRILSTLGADVRLIAILRHPVERAYSMYWHRRRDAEEPLSFEQAIAAERERIEAGWELGWHYLEMGRYRRQLERYYALFPSEQILVLSLDEFRADRPGVLRRVTDFLDLTPFTEVPSIESENRSFTLRFPVVETLVRKVGRPGASLGRLLPSGLKRAAKSGIRRLNTKHAGYEELDPRLKRELSAEFREDILYLASEVSPHFEPWARDLR